MEINFYTAFRFANIKHQNQKIVGSNLPYISHISSVCFELFQNPNIVNYDLDFLFNVACLHDTLEDTETTEIEILELFGIKILNAVKSLSKNYKLPKEIQLEESINRILLQPVEVHIVKIADRLTNLYPPPKTWPMDKIVKYHQSSIMLFNKFKNSDNYLITKLEKKIQEYGRYCSK